MTYQELLYKLKSLDGKQKQIDALFGYLLKMVEYDYPTLEICKLDNSLAAHIDSTYSPSSAEDRQKVVELLKGKGYSTEFINRMLANYGREVLVPARPERFSMGKLQKAVPEHVIYTSFLSAQNMAKPVVKYENGIITKGVCADYAIFIKKVCDDLDIECKTIDGTTPVFHGWNLIDGGEGLLHYDLTYAVFSRDQFNGWDRLAPKDWLGITTDRLLEIHPTRKIDAPLSFG